MYQVSQESLTPIITFFILLVPMASDGDDSVGGKGLEDLVFKLQTINYNTIVH